MLARSPALHPLIPAPPCAVRSVPLRRSKGVNSSWQLGRLGGFVSNLYDQLTGSVAELPNFSEVYDRLRY